MQEKSPEKKKLPSAESAVEESAPETAEERQKRQEEEEELAVEKLKSENDELREKLEQLQLDIKTMSAKLPKVRKLLLCTFKNLKHPHLILNFNLLILGFRRKRCCRAHFKRGRSSTNCSTQSFGPATRCRN